VPLELKIPSFAKINLGLRIVGRREDGYHELCTVFQTISLHDELIFSEADELRLECDGEVAVPVDGNIILKAAEWLRSRFGVSAGARIVLRKRIPSPGGLGGGSSNAAVSLLALRRLWRIDIGIGELLTIGRALGADVPFFLFGGTALGTGRGDVIESLSDVDLPPILLVVPNAEVGTAEAFARVNSHSLTSESSNRILQICRSEAESAVFLQGTLNNDLEPSVFETFPEVRRVKETLIRLGAVTAAMSGSGASVFAIFDKEETRQTALKALDAEVNWRKFAVAAISRDQYRDALRLVF